MNRILLAGVLVILLSCVACASVIRLTSTMITESVVEGKNTTVNISIANTGDEPAYNVMLSLLLPDGFSSKPISPGILKPNEPFNGTFEVKIKEDAAPGMYPLVLLTNYADANSYPFSTVSAKSIVYKQTTPINVFGALSSVELTDKKDGAMTLKIRNMDDKPHTLNVELYLPQELKADGTERTLSVPGKGEVGTEFGVSSFGALGGSTYAAFAVISYADDGLMHSSIAGNVVRISGGAPTTGSQVASRTADSKSSKTATYALTASLIVLIALGLFYGTKKK